jgi:hypothetical protein
MGVRTACLVRSDDALVARALRRSRERHEQKAEQRRKSEQGPGFVGADSERRFLDHRTKIRFHRGVRYIGGPLQEQLQIESDCLRRGDVASYQPVAKGFGVSASAARMRPVFMRLTGPQNVGTALTG